MTAPGPHSTPRLHPIEQSIIDALDGEFAAQSEIAIKAQRLFVSRGGDQFVMITANAVGTVCRRRRREIGLEAELRHVPWGRSTAPTYFWRRAA